MKLHGKIAVTILCLAAICGAAFWWLTHKKAEEQKLAAQVKATRALAEQGDAQAQYRLGRMYHYGQGVPQDNDEVLRWYRKAADQGYAAAEYGVGYMYMYGLGVQSDYTEAVRWCRKAADQGYAKAQDSLGSSYFYGYGVAKDDSQAVFWYRRAADQGYARAEYELGYMYSQGRGVPKDKDEANRWYRKAADHGDEYAQRALGLRRPPMATWTKLILLVYLLGGLLLSSSILSWRKNNRDRRLSRSTWTGLLVLLYAGIDWFQYSPYCLFPSIFAVYAYRSVVSFLSGIIITLLLLLVCSLRIKLMLAFSGILFLVLNLGLCVIAHFNLRFLASEGPKLLYTNACPFGIAISAMILHLYTRKKAEVCANDDAIESDEDAKSI
jgi:hypothetical protein